jgi:hypothetical protein
MAAFKSRVPPLVLTRSGNAGRANDAPLSLSGQAPRSIVKLSIGLRVGAVKAKYPPGKKPPVFDGLCQRTLRFHSSFI